MLDAAQPRPGISFITMFKGIISQSFNRIWRSRITRGLLRRLIPRPIRNYYHTYRAGYFSYEKTHVILYADSSVLPEYEYRRPPGLHRQLNIPRSKVSLITTVLEGETKVQPWLESLSQQTRLPDEVVIAERGLAGKASVNIGSLIHTAPFPVRLVDASGKSNAEAINMAIQNTAYPLIASTEVSCTPAAGWLENLAYPLDADPDVQLSAGFFQAHEGSHFQRLCARILTPPTDYFQAPSFVPSWRSVALRKTLWAQADGYPEWLGNISGEALFNCQARQNKGVWAVVPGANVSMDMPEHLADLSLVRYQEGLADGLTGINAAKYWNKTLKLAAVASLVGFTLLAAVLSPIIFGLWGWIVPGMLLAFGMCFVLFGVFSMGREYKLGVWDSVVILAIRLIAGLACMVGFASGVRVRPAAQARQITHFQSQLQHILDQHPQRKGIIIYPPTHDWGYMFQLPQQMARQFARLGYLYFYATINEIVDDVTGFRQVEPNLFLSHVPFETFQMLASNVGDRSRPTPDRLILYIGSPWNRKYLPFFTDPTVIYDHYDDLAVSSGRLEDHQSLLQTAHLVLVTSQRLLDNVKDIRPDTIFAPNGVDFEHFQELRPAQGEAAPADLQPILATGKPIIGYTGALSERFDYDLFLHLAQSRPAYEFVLVGASIDGSLERSNLLKAHLGNVSWLGVKPHDVLIKYLWRFHVGIVPFKLIEITLATTSIKVFEYMACQVPVVSVAMPESKRYPGVFIAETYAQFVEQVDAALEKKQDDGYQALIDQVARANTWEKRANVVITAITHPL